MFGVSWKELDADAGNDGCVAAEERRASAGDKRIVVVGEIADTIAFVLLVRVGQLAALIVIAGAREGGNDGAIGAAYGVPAAVVEVKMSVDDDIEIIGSKAGGIEIGKQALFVVVDAAGLLGQFVAGSGVDEDGVIRGADGQRVHGDMEAILASAGSFFSQRGLGTTPNMAPPSR